MLEASRVGSVDTGRTGKRFGGNRDTRVREETGSASDAALEIATPEDETATGGYPWRAGGSC